MTIGGAKSVEKLEAQAAAWAIKIDSAQDRSPPGLQEWCAQDPKHSGALLRAQAALALFEPAEAILAEDKKPLSWRRWTVVGGGMAVLAAAIAAVLLTRVPNEHYETQIGEVRTVALSDGSSMSIDARSRIEIAYTAANRDVRLLSGKALFHAVHNAQRPFRVIAGNVVVTDMGTTFQVADDEPSGDVEVLVTQGSVRVTSPSGEVGLTTGQRAIFRKVMIAGTQPKPVSMAPVDIDRMLAWRESRLELDGETLESAVADINRHSRLQLRIGDAALGRQRLYGSFRMDDAAGFASAAAMSLGTKTYVEPDGIVIGSKKNKLGS